MFAFGSSQRLGALIAGTTGNSALKIKPADKISLVVLSIVVTTFTISMLSGAQRALKFRIPASASSRVGLPEVAQLLYTKTHSCPGHTQRSPILNAGSLSTINRDFIIKNKTTH